MRENFIQNNPNEVIHFAHTKSDSCNVEIHLHDSYEIFMSLSENLRYYIEGKIYDLAKYDIIITNEKEVHRPMLMGSGIYERRFVQFNPSVFSGFFYDSYNPLNIFESRALGQNNKIVLPGGNNHIINKIFDDIKVLKNTSSEKNKLLIKALMVNLFTELEQLYSKVYETIDYIGESDERIDKVIKDLNKNFKKPFCLEELSRNHFMDKYYLCHLFKETTGFSMMEYVKSKRIQYAKLLISKGEGIMEAANLCGFTEYSNFYKSFTKLVGMSPKKYRDYIS